MAKTLIRYRVKPEKIDENQQLVEDVFRELHAKSPKDARYLVFKLSDGTFCHLFEDSAGAIASLEAFAAFRAGGEDRRLDEPQRLEATIVGNYRMLVDS
jgi:hypothetical protein